MSGEDARMDPAYDLLVSLEKRQDEVLAQIDALISQIDQVLASSSPKRGDASDSDKKHSL